MLSAGDDHFVTLRDIETFDAASQQAIERLTAMAGEIFEGAKAGLAMIEGDSVRLTACTGLEPDGVALSDTFRGVVLRCGPNATFAGAEEGSLRFYAGAALTGDDGRNLGALCVLDDKPREAPTRAALRRLRQLAQLVVDRLDAALLKRRAQRQSQLLSFVEHSAKTGHWVCDLRQGVVTLSHEARRIRGVDPIGGPIGMEAALAPYPPDQRVLVVEHLERVARNGGGFELMMQLTRPDGSTRDILCRGQARRRATDGEMTTVYGVIQDVTEHQDRLRAVEATKAALAESEARHRLIAESARDVITRTSLSGELIYVSPSVEAVAGYRPADLIGRSIVPLVHPRDRAGFLHAYRRISNGEPADGQSIRYRVRRAGGGWVWVEGNPTAVLDADGRPTGYVDVSRDVDDHIRLETDLRAARDEAKAAAEAKSEFLSNMSHELRTPLTAMIGFAGLLGARPELEDRSRHMVERIASAGARLMDVINDVLDFSKLEAGAVVVAPEPTDVRALVSETAQLLEDRATAKGVALVVEIAQDAPASVNVDAGRMRQVLLNLAGNAVKFTPAGQVAIRLEAAEGGVLVKVMDSGPGLTADQIGRLFQRFEQLDGSSARSYGGTGLGLAISKALVEAMGGKIGVWSRPGRGSTFWFHLPDAPAAAAEGVAA